MIIIRKIKNQEFQEYKNYFIEDYGNEIEKNYGHSSTVSQAIAQKELEESFPKDIISDTNKLMCIETIHNDIKVPLGYIWYTLQPSNKTAFICDFYIFMEHRSKGYGKATIEVLEKMLVENDIEQIKLRVAYYNERALNLYKEIGFNITGFNMSKKIVK